MPQRPGVKSPELVFPFPNVVYHDAAVDDRAGLVRGCEVLRLDDPGGNDPITLVIAPFSFSQWWIPELFGRWSRGACGGHENLVGRR